MTEYRVKFDFVVHFTNGGSLSAQDFRLDIPGSDIADDELAAYLIQDMRLLMAGQVDITNKQILEEPHKRAAISTAGLPRVTIDLSKVSLSAAALLAQAKNHPIRVVASDGRVTKSPDSWSNNSFKPTPITWSCPPRAGRSGSFAPAPL